MSCLRDFFGGVRCSRCRQMAGENCVRAGYEYCTFAVLGSGAGAGFGFSFLSRTFVLLVDCTAWHLLVAGFLCLCLSVSLSPFPSCSHCVCISSPPPISLRAIKDDLRLPPLRMKRSYNVDAALSELILAALDDMASSPSPRHRCVLV